MDLKSRLTQIEERLGTLERVSRLRSADISEGQTEFRDTAVLSAKTLTMDNSSRIHGENNSWEIGVNEDGTTYSVLGDVLISGDTGVSAKTVVEFDRLVVPTPAPETRIVIEDKDESMAVLYGTVEVQVPGTTSSVSRVITPRNRHSLVVLPGTTQVIPLLERVRGGDEIIFQASSSPVVSINVLVMRQYEY